MSNADNNKTRDERPAKKVPKGDYEVGYCRPDPKVQFKPGNNANPNGRPRGSRNGKGLVKEAFLELIPVREGNTTKKVSKIAAVLTQTINDALKGNHKARLAAIGLAQMHGILTPETEEAIEENLPEHDKKILEEYNRRHSAARSAAATEAPAHPNSVPAAEGSRPDAGHFPAAPLPKLTRPVVLK
jgi:hypothetical protein